MNEKYSKACTEVLEIISYFSEEEYNKISNEKIRFYKENQDKNYIYKINPKNDLKEQNISKEAEILLVALFRDCFATPKQKEILKGLLKQNQEKAEKEKEEKYNSNEIFKNRRNIEQIEKYNPNEELSLIEVKEEKLYIKILEFFRKKFISHQ